MKGENLVGMFKGEFIMKKIIYALLISSMALMLASCGEKEEASEKEKTSSTSISENSVDESSQSSSSTSETAEEPTYKKQIGSEWSDWKTDRRVWGTYDINMQCPYRYKDAYHLANHLVTIDASEKDNILFFFDADHSYNYTNEDGVIKEFPPANEIHYEENFQSNLENQLISIDIQYQYKTMKFNFDAEEETVDMLSQKLIKRTGVIDGEKLPAHSHNSSPTLRFISYTFLQNDSEHANDKNVAVCWIIMSECTDSETFQKMDDVMKDMIESAQWEKEKVN